MPCYVFKCPRPECGKVFESLMKPYEPVECAHCKMRWDSAKENRVLSEEKSDYHWKCDNPGTSPARKLGGKFEQWKK